MKPNRPINLNLFTISFPLPAIVSILHRITGVILFLLLPFALWALNQSLASQQDYDAIQQYFTHPAIKFITWCALSALLFHLVAGIRHLFMDLHIGEGLKSGKVSALMTIIISALLIAMAGVWLW